MSDLISREEAIDAVNMLDIFPPTKDVVARGLMALPSAEAEPIVIRSKTLLPTKDFKEWAKRIREVNPNAIVIPCDAEVVSADAVHGEWIEVEDYNGDVHYKCDQCGEEWTFPFGTPKENNANFCPNCGARMKGGDDE